MEAWSASADRHRERARRWTVPYRERRSRGRSHPVHDFLFQYYGYSPGKLEQWHPAVGEAIEYSPEARRRFPGPFYRRRAAGIVHSLDAWSESSRDRVGRALEILAGTLARPPNLGCFGMHEWAMVYRGTDVRHRSTAPLRLSQREIDALVEERPLTCTHFDAYRFFEPAARTLNRIRPTPQDRALLEQPGCIHANMDLYRFAYEAMPWVGTDFLWSTFELAAELRSLDMRASPYDLMEFGVVPIPIETERGRDEYRALQRELFEGSQRLRGALVDRLEALFAWAEAG
jgi:hypothetical protein